MTKSGLQISNQCLDTKTGEPTLCDFRLMFSVIFPMATGIMEGANLSGVRQLRHIWGAVAHAFQSACLVLTYMLGI